MHKQRMMVLFAAILGIIASFIPWTNFRGGSEFMGMLNAQWASFILFLIVLAIAALGNRMLAIHSMGLTVITIIGIVILAYAVYFLLDLKGAFALGLEDYPRLQMLQAQVRASAGVYLTMVFTFLMVALAWMMRSNAAYRPDNDVPLQPPT